MKRIKILFILYLIIDSEAYWLSSPIIWESNGHRFFEELIKEFSFHFTTTIAIGSNRSELITEFSGIPITELGYFI
jgi:hypothetical protein